MSFTEITCTISKSCKMRIDNECDIEGELEVGIVDIDELHSNIQTVWLNGTTAKLLVDKLSKAYKL